MKRIFFGIMVIAQVVCADWTLNVVYNESDLKLDGAYRLKKGGKRKSTYLDKKIKLANQSKPVIMIDYKTFTKADSQGYLCITLHDRYDEKYELFFDSQPAHAIEWHRSKTKKIGTEIESVSDTALYARVFLKSVGHQDVHIRYAYEEAIDLDLIIHGKDGLYSLELSEPIR